MQDELFRVHITGKDGAAKRCHLGGDYQLLVKDFSLCLSGAKLNQVIYEWPYPDIRCYGYTNKAFNFVAGRSSSWGEGTFSMKTKDGDAIYKSVHGKVQLMKTNLDPKHHPMSTHRSEPLPPPSVRVQSRRKEARNIRCQFVYTEPCSTRAGAGVDGGAGDDGSDGAGTSGSDAELCDGCAGGSNDYTSDPCS